MNYAMIPELLLSCVISSGEYSELPTLSFFKKCPKVFIYLTLLWQMEKHLKIELTIKWKWWEDGTYPSLSSMNLIFYKYNKIIKFTSRTILISPILILSRELFLVLFNFLWHLFVLCCLPLLWLGNQSRADERMITYYEPFKKEIIINLMCITLD